MIILSASNLCKSYGVDVILQNISFHISSGDKVGIVGVNGAGKTTLLNILTGELDPDSGDFFVAKDKTIGYLKQRDYFDASKTVIEEVSGIFARLEEMETEIERLTEEIARAEDETVRSGLWNKLNALQNDFEQNRGYTYRSEITGVMSSMGFDEDSYDTLTGRLSGGERTRLALACLLLRKPDILILDEPTNHLDIGALSWLEQYLKNYKGTIIMVSHDRYFLDEISTHIFEIENRTLTAYRGNYSSYAEKKREVFETELKAYNKQQEEIKRQETLIRSYKERGTEKLAKRAQSREKRLAHVERLEKPQELKATVKIDFHEKFQSGNDVLFGEELAFGYGSSDSHLFDHVNFDIKRGERICIVGDNGIGKTTLLKIMMGRLNPVSGYVKQGHNVEIGYYDQGQLLLRNDATVLDEIHDEYRLYTDGEIRNILGRFLFRGDMVFNKVGDLSGGEKARLSLLKLMMSGANVLVLDEPTNHLDIRSKEAFEDALIEYPGTVITVTHDRYFLNRIPDRIFELTNGGLVEYLGKYDYYLEKKAGSQGDAEATSGTKGTSKDANQVDVRENVDETSGLTAQEFRILSKQREAEERRRNREIERLSARIEELELLIEQGEAKLELPENMSDYTKLQQIAQELEDWKKDLDDCYNRWMGLMEK